ncbi:MAG TPA: hypothetical protein DF774_03515 [Rheinheimera sp.]|uniref:hypothetical protein n=1 Tax=Rheinheimera sp. TaxID=1869214 RepID=UPI000EDB610F|nr:hypothetical protein [Rheinheimera sp.]HCU64806.1 hypothetical protein [Rheinheimera sp.]
MRDIILNIVKAPQIFFAKQTIKRKRQPMSIDIRSYQSEDFGYIIPTLRNIEQQLLALPASKSGMRWIHHQETVYFYGEREFDVPYDEFIRKVSFCHAGEFYRDSVSTDTHVVRTDHQGRPLHQVVRIVALPQPNYAAFMGKGNLDVYKLEQLDYSENEQRVWMYTVHSPNGSAVCDDGYLAFRRVGDGSKTRVSFLACQNFPIPPLMALLQLDKWTWLKTKLTEHAYKVFCNTMFNNIRDCYLGIKFQVGRD